ncbi:MAG: hypothetical protein WC711_01110 [Candidatus Staskawiczbacteria bacterium]|jgi:hypothetical protein
MKKANTAIQNYISDRTLACVRKRLEELEKLGWRIHHYSIWGPKGLVIVFHRLATYLFPSAKIERCVCLNDFPEWRDLIVRLASRGWRFLSFQSSSSPKAPYRFRQLIEKG